MGTSHQKVFYDQEKGIYTSTDIKPVASRGCIFTGFSSTNKQIMSRSKHIAMDDISSIGVMFTGWYGLNGAFGTDTNAGGSIDYKATLEYRGQLYRITFSEEATGTCPDGGILESDIVKLPFTIRKGESFYIRSFASSAVGFLYQNVGGFTNFIASGAPPSGEWTTFGVTTTDHTNTLTNVNNQSATVSFRPVAVIGYSARPVIALFSDSRGGTLGTGLSAPVVTDGFGLKGEIEPGVGRRFASINFGVSGERLANFTAGVNSAKRIELANRYCDAAVANMGVNDVTDGTTASTILGYYTAMANLFPGMPFFVSTITPHAPTSTDGWGTVANQTTHANNSVRISVNASIRNGLGAPITGYIELADTVESARDSGKWKGAERTVTGTLAITTGTPTLTDSANGFVPSDVNKHVAVPGAGAAGGVLITNIKTFTSAGSVNLQTNASTTVSLATGYVGLYTADGLHPQHVAQMANAESNSWNTLYLMLD